MNTSDTLDLDKTQQNTDNKLGRKTTNIRKYSKPHEIFKIKQEARHMVMR